jgi:hypothetical protein
MIFKVFRGISKDFAELTKSPRRLKWKKLQIILVLISEFFFCCITA